jgi:hypothetical protein
MKIKSLIILLTLCSTLLLGQEIKTDSISKEEISKLEFLIGEWQGEGWILGRDQQKHQFQQTENIHFKIDGVAILIEGLGKTNGQITHNAIAIISYNKKESNYSFQSYTSTGYGGSFKAELIEGKFFWYPNDNMRYVIWINEQGQWYETGEFKVDEKWSQFFEMTLDKMGN